MTTTTEPQLGSVRAICDVCGEVRHITARLGYGKSAEAGFRDEGVSRCMVRVKCANCRRQTPHAYLRDFERYADHCEQEQAKATEGVRALFDAARLRTLLVAAFAAELGTWDGLKVGELAIRVTEDDESRRTEVFLPEDLDAVGELRHLQQAWKILTPGEKWDERERREGWKSEGDVRTCFGEWEFGDKAQPRR